MTCPRGLPLLPRNIKTVLTPVILTIVFCITVIMRGTKNNDTRILAIADRTTETNLLDGTHSSKQTLVISDENRGIPLFGPRRNIHESHHGFPRNDFSKASRSAYGYHDITLKLDIDAHIDAATAERIPALQNYKNPCWLERVNATYSYADNSIVLSREGTNSKGNHLKTLSNMRRIILSRGSNNDGVSWRLRCLPFFYIAGVSKCGTTDLATTLARHHQIIHPLRKETSYWNRIRYHGLPKNMTHIWEFDDQVPASVPRPFRHYVDFYDPISEIIRSHSVYDDITQTKQHRQITGDFTPSYLYEFIGWRQMAANQNEAEPKKIIADMIYQLTPNAKIVLILRNPTTRLLSEYLFFLRNVEKNNYEFKELVTRAIQILDECFAGSNFLRACVYDKATDNRTTPLRLWVGLYYIFILDWLKVFPRNQIFITRLEDYAVNRTRIVNQIAEFLDIDSFRTASLNTLHVKNSKKAKKNEFGEMWNDTKTLLDNYYEPWNNKLAQLLGDDKFRWRGL